jgi:hypothetical protein
LTGHLKAKEFELEEVAGQRQLSVGDAGLRQVARERDSQKASDVAFELVLYFIGSVIETWNIPETAVNTDARIVSTGCREEIGKFSSATSCRWANMSSLIQMDPRHLT